MPLHADRGGAGQRLGDADLGRDRPDSPAVGVRAALGVSALALVCSPLIRPHSGTEAGGLAVAGGGEVAGYGAAVCAFGLELGFGAFGAGS